MNYQTFGGRKNCLKKLGGHKNVSKKGRDEKRSKMDVDSVDKRRQALISDQVEECSLVDVDQ